MLAMNAAVVLYGPVMQVEFDGTQLHQEVRMSWHDFLRYRIA
jgi:hypothetical protein